MTDDAGDDGFTLIELLLAIVIASVVFGVVSASFIIALRSTGESTDRLLESQAGAFTSASFVKDVQGASTVSRSGTCTGAAGTAVLSLTGVEVLGGSTGMYSADYRYDSSARTLTRYTCGSSTSARLVASRLASAPTALCEGARGLTGTRPVVSGCSTSTTRTITLSLVTQVDGRFDITASRRLR